MSITSSVTVNNIESNGDTQRENLNHNNGKNDTPAQVSVQVESPNTQTVNQAPNRPIAASDLPVFDTVKVAGIRPISSVQSIYF